MKLETLLLGLLFRAVEVGLRSPFVLPAPANPIESHSGHTCNCTCTFQVATSTSSHWDFLLGLGAGSLLTGGAGFVRGQLLKVPSFHDSPRRRGGGYIHFEGS